MALFDLGDGRRGNRVAGKRHHTIPQFLQRGFASSGEGAAARIWMYRKGHPGRQVGIADTAVERFFYGDPSDPELDEAITRLEYEYVPLIDDLRSRGNGELIRSTLIPEMVAHLAVRTRYIRQYSIRTVTELTDQIAQELRREGTATRHVMEAIERPGPEREKIETAAFAHGGADGVSLVKSPKGRRLIEAHLRNNQGFPHAIDADIDEFVAEMKRQLPEAIRGAMNAAMLNNLRLPIRADSYRKLRWHVVFVKDCVLLGDTVIVAETAGQRRFKPLDDRGDHIHRIYLPIAADRLLVGSHGRECPKISERELNQVLARCSYEFFLSSIQLGAESTEELGKWSGLLSERELKKIRRELIKSVQVPRGSLRSQSG